MKFPAFSGRKEVAEFLARGYSESGSPVLANINVLKLIADKLPSRDIQVLPLQPNIDVLWYDQKADELNGVIVRYFRQPAEAVMRNAFKSCQLKPSRY
jgi:hypothetical protein